ncbi:MAG: pyruvate ferredoxin oxidoreductase [Deltaproteobacteria bacterium]|nr:MAG: pyruvate ferredoxin oxidoreductase [Deltaproteobacteria bacterium]
MKKLITANHAAGLAATLAGRANRKGRGFGGGVYPITPQTESIEFLSRQEIEKGSIVRVESEHSAMAVCIGFSMSGARAFTASSSNGLAYMTENVITAAMYRLPIVMLAVNRTLGPPWNIWVDHNDTLLLRDAGWMQIYCEDNQEVFDSILLAYRIAEDRRVLLPVMVCADAFVLSHTLMTTEIPEQDAVDAFLPVLDLHHRIAQAPRTVGGLDFPHETEVHRGQMQAAMGRIFEVYGEAQGAFEEIFGRRPADPVVPYRMDDAEVALVSMGTTAATARQAVDAAREKGIRAGALRVKVFRPFPETYLVEALSGVRKIAVLDRDLSPGFGGILWGELRGALRGGQLVQSYLAGLGGGDVRPEHLLEILEDLEHRSDPVPSILKEVA